MILLLCWKICWIFDEILKKRDFLKIINLYICDIYEQQEFKFLQSYTLRIVKFKQVSTRLDKFRPVLTSLDQFGHVYTKLKCVQYKSSLVMCNPILTS